jgi:hypothetical protein
MKFVKIFLLLIFISFAIIAQTKIPVKGSAEIKGTGQDANFKARQEAITNGYKSGLKKSILKIIPENSLKENESKINEEILSQAKAYVKEEEIMDEDVSDGKYLVSLQLVIDEKKLTESLNSLSLGAASGGLTDMVLAVAIDELVYDGNKTLIEVRTGAKSMSGSKISEELLSKKISLKSEDIIEQIRNELVGPGGNLSSIVTGKTGDTKSELAAKMISGQYKIDAIVFGTTQINYSGKDKSGFDIATASANIRVIEVSTGKVLAASISNETGIAKTQSEAYAAAARRLGSVLGPKITTELHSKWLTILNDGADYELNFNGSIDDKLKTELMSTLKSISGLTNLTEKKWNKKESNLLITAKYKGKPSALKEEIYKNCSANLNLSGLREEIVSGNMISYYIDKPIKGRGIETGNPPIAGFQKPTIHAVVVGVSKYADESMNLNAAVSDAELIKAYIISKDGLNVNENNVKFISDKDATKANILKTIKDEFSKSSDNDLVILYFAGHGWAEEKEMYFLGHDTKKDNIKGTSVSQKDLQQALNSTPAKRQIFIADACHSGATSLAYMTYASASNTSAARGVDNRVSLIKNIIGSSQGLAVLTAASANQQAQEGPQWGGHGLFTYTLMEGLKGEADLNKDKVITVNEAFIYTIIKMSQETLGKQTPTVMGPLDLPLGVLK